MTDPIYRMPSGGVPANAEGKPIRITREQFEDCCCPKFECTCELFQDGSFSDPDNFGWITYPTLRGYVMAGEYRHEPWSPCAGGWDKGGVAQDSRYTCLVSITEEVNVSYSVSGTFGYLVQGGIRRGPWFGETSMAVIYIVDDPGSPCVEIPGPEVIVPPFLVPTASETLSAGDYYFHFIAWEGNPALQGPNAAHAGTDIIFRIEFTPTAP